eukprot:1058018-Pelagomonas_calceolata.AAC.5
MPGDLTRECCDFGERAPFGEQGNPVCISVQRGAWQPEQGGAPFGASAYKHNCLLVTSAQKEQEYLQSFATHVDEHRSVLKEVNAPQTPGPVKLLTSGPVPRDEFRKVAFRRPSHELSSHKLEHGGMVDKDTKAGAHPCDCWNLSSTMH